MTYSIAEIARALGAEMAGDGTYRIARAAEPAAAGKGDLALAMDARKYGAALRAGRAEAAVLWEGADWQELGLVAAIFVKRPRVAMASLTSMLDAGGDRWDGIHPSAVVAKDAVLAEDAAIGPFCVIGPGARVGPGARIGAHVTIAGGANVGSAARIADGVRIARNVRIGDRFICQPNAVIGSDGFSFVTPEKSAVEHVRGTLGDRGDATGQGWLRIHSLGGVEIGDDVEIGAASAIDAGTIRATEIGSGTKLDNLVHVGHNVTVGRDCLLCGQVGIAGSARIGDRVVLGGQCGVSDNIFVGDDVIAGGATKIFSNAPAGRVLLGSPALKMETHVEAWKNIRRLGRLYEQVADLRARIERKDQDRD
jgi:UDP-3-O-[3-hydroxymyristoyl] glucosamine N-acyltransferase